jgi:hypothetical protein
LRERVNFPPRDKDLLMPALITLHVLGFMALSTGLAYEFMAVIGTLLAPNAQTLNKWLFPLPAVKPLMISAAVLLLGTGFTMAINGTDWSFASGWIRVATAVTIMLAINGGAVLEPRLNVLRSATDTINGGVTTEIAGLMRAPGLHYPAWGALGTVVPILVLMSAHPGLLLSICLILVGAVAGLLTCTVVLARVQPRVVVLAN